MAAYNKLVGDLKEAKDQGFENRWNELRAFCFGMCRMFVALLLCNQASKDPRNKHIEVFSRWVSMQELYHNRFNNRQMDRELALDLDATNSMRAKGESDSRGHLRPRF